MAATSGTRNSNTSWCGSGAWGCGEGARFRADWVHVKARVRTQGFCHKAQPRFLGACFLLLFPLPFQEHYAKYWNRRNGRDHLMTHAGGHRALAYMAPCMGPVLPLQNILRFAVVVTFGCSDSVQVTGAGVRRLGDRIARPSSLRQFQTQTRLPLYWTVAQGDRARPVQRLPHPRPGGGRGC